MLDVLLELVEPVTTEQQREFAWSEESRSKNMLLGRDPMKVLRKAVPNSTDAIRGQKAMSSGLHIWQIRWHKSHHGTYAAIGVGTSQAKLQVQGNGPLLGQDEHSFGWNIVSRKCRHAGKEWDFPTGANALRALPDRLYAILDCEKGTLAFAAQNDYLGVAFRGLQPGQAPLFPMVAAIWGNAQISIRYIGTSSPEVLKDCEDEMDDQITEMSGSSRWPRKEDLFKLGMSSPLLVDFF